MSLEADVDAVVMVVAASVADLVQRRRVRSRWVAPDLHQM